MNSNKNNEQNDKNNEPECGTTVNACAKEIFPRAIGSAALR
jgi:hypothetical protein